MTNRFFAFLFLGICIETVHLQALKCNTIDPILALFLKKYAPPAEVIKHLDERQEFISCNITDSILAISLHKNTSHPEYFLKSETDRLLNAIRLKNFIRKENLTALGVPEKYIYCKNNQCIIIAKCIEAVENQIITPKMVEQLLTVAEKTNFSDWHENNLIRNKDGKLYIIDTDTTSFASNKNAAPNLPSNTAVQAVGHLHLFLRDQQTLDRFKVLAKDKEASTKVVTPIYNNSSLDPEDFDLEEIKEKLYRYTNNKT